jgi:hypothetical protein
LRIFRDYVASRPNKNRIGLRRRQMQLRSNTACQEDTARRSAVQPHGVSECGIELRRSRWASSMEGDERAEERG